MLTAQMMMRAAAVRTRCNIAPSACVTDLIGMGGGGGGAPYATNSNGR